MVSQNNDIRPTKKEQKALEPFFNRFYTLYDGVTSNDFMNESPELRFYKIKELFLLYIEMTNYELIKNT